MPRSKKWNYELIKKVIDERGDQLISTGKMTSKTDITILCRLCHQEFVQRFESYYKECQGNCACPTKKRLWNIDTVRAYIQNEGETLVDTQYINIKTLLSIVCKICKNTYLQCFERYQNGHKHKDCSPMWITGRLVPPVRPITIVKKQCSQCSQEFSVAKKRDSQQTCSPECYEAYKKSEVHIATCRKGGLAAIKVSSPRSKNEIHFATLCLNYFENVVTNEQMFDGWDADVILLDHKIAVHWNGIWHYQVVRKGMDLEKTQKRDRTKEEVILKHGYISYTIKDMGSENKKFVEKEFETFVNFVEFLNIESD